ncbi:MAG: nuclear transport factor 2 family protein [Microbacteriaceae bacterium]
MDTAETMKYLTDRAEIHDVVVMFAYGIDTRNWPLFRSTLADSVEMHYPDSVGISTFTGDGLTKTAEAFFSRLDATQHVSANHLITIDGDRAICTSTLLAQHYLAAQIENPVQRQVGYYVNTLARLDGWKIVRSEQRVSWQDGNTDVFLHAAGAFA